MKELNSLYKQIKLANNKVVVWTFEKFIEKFKEKPTLLARNIFQVFHDMITKCVGEGKDEYPDDPESINFLDYDFNNLLVKGFDDPFFADRLFANRFMRAVKNMRFGTQQNKIYIFHGPPGCGKSTFLNNLLSQFESYSNSEAGHQYEVVWRLNKKLLNITAIDKNIEFGGGFVPRKDMEGVDFSYYETDKYIEVSCPSHDHPLLIIPREYRKSFLSNLFGDVNIFADKDYEWIFKEQVCTICESLYKSMINFLTPEDIFKMVYVRPLRVDRRIGEGITIYNPGDAELRQKPLGNPALQKRISEAFHDGAKFKYLFSRSAKTNNGIYALMDVKGNNVGRLKDLHNVVSEGIRKIDDIEESISSFFIAVMTPEDKKEIKDIKSFEDRIDWIYMPYVLDIDTEVKIYKDIFGEEIEDMFQPGVLENFAKIVVLTRIMIRSEAIHKWIEDPKIYVLCCDDNLMLLKIEIYRGIIPDWLSDKDRASFTASVRRTILLDSESEGNKGYSGRESIIQFGKFYAKHCNRRKLIDMKTVHGFFDSKSEPARNCPGALAATIKLYDYSILNQVKDCMYFYNLDKIGKDIKNYIYALNFDVGDTVKCPYTGDEIEITDDWLNSIDIRFVYNREEDVVYKFRDSLQNKFTSESYTKEIQVEGKDIEDTKLYNELLEKYIRSLKEKVMEPFVKNENFRRAIKDYGTEEFESYDKRIKREVNFLIDNLQEKYNYTEQGAKEICIYAIDNGLAERFEEIRK